MENLIPSGSPMLGNTMLGSPMCVSPVCGSSMCGSPRPGAAGRAMKRLRGFTFVELMVVVTIMVILISMAIPIYNRSIIRAKESVLKNNLFTHTVKGGGAGGGWSTSSDLAAFAEA